MEGDDIWVGGDELVIISLAGGVPESLVNVVGGWDARLVWIGDIDDFQSATNVSVNPARRLEIDDLVHGAESASTDATLDKVAASDFLSNEGGFGSGNHEIQQSGEGYSVARWGDTGHTFKCAPYFILSMRTSGYRRFRLASCGCRGSGLEMEVRDSVVIEGSVLGS